MGDVADILAAVRGGGGGGGGGGSGGGSGSSGGGAASAAAAAAAAGAPGGGAAAGAGTGAGAATSANPAGIVGTGPRGFRALAQASKPKGLSREVLALQQSWAEDEGEGAPPLAPGPASSAVAAGAAGAGSGAGAAPLALGGPGRRFVVDPAKRTRRWAWHEFKNPARADGARLKHWKREDAVTDEYVFTRFNKPTFVLRYSGERYEAAVAPDDAAAGWSRAETDLLFAMCERFDSRWPVVGDRYRAEAAKRGLAPPRSTTELKERYYAVARRLAAVPGEDARADTPPASLGRTGAVSQRFAAAARATLAAFEFNRAAEEERLALLNRQFRMTKDEEEEEQRLVAELQRVDGELRRLQREQRKEKAKKRQTSHKKKTPEDNISIGSDDDADETLLEAAALTQDAGPVALRSQRLEEGNTLGLGPRLAKKLAKVLHLLNAPDDPVPTAAVCDAYDDLRRDIVKMLAVRKALNKKLQVLGISVPLPLDFPREGELLPLPEGSVKVSGKGSAAGSQGAGSGAAPPSSSASSAAAAAAPAGGARPAEGESAAAPAAGGGSGSGDGAALPAPAEAKNDAAAPSASRVASPAQGGADGTDEVDSVNEEEGGAGGDDDDDDGDANAEGDGDAGAGAGEAEGEGDAASRKRGRPSSKKGAAGRASGSPSTAGSGSAKPSHKKRKR